MCIIIRHSLYVQSNILWSPPSTKIKPPSRSWGALVHLIVTPLISMTIELTLLWKHTESKPIWKKDIAHKIYDLPSDWRESVTKFCSSGYRESPCFHIGKIPIRQGILTPPVHLFKKCGSGSIRHESLIVARTTDPRLRAIGRDT